MYKNDIWMLRRRSLPILMFIFYIRTRKEIRYFHFHIIKIKNRKHTYNIIKLISVSKNKRSVKGLELSNFTTYFKNLNTFIVRLL